MQNAELSHSLCCNVNYIYITSSNEYFFDKKIFSFLLPLDPPGGFLSGPLVAGPVRVTLREGVSLSSGRGSSCGQ